MTEFSKTTREQLGAFYLLLSIGFLSLNIYLDITTEDPPIWYFVITAFLAAWFLFELYMFFKAARRGGVYAGLEAVERVG